MIHLTGDQIKQISECCEPDDLPGDLSEVAELLGAFKALLLGYHIGCGRIYLKAWSDDPSKWSKDIKLIVDIVGVDDAKLMVSNFTSHNPYGGHHGSHVDILKCDKFWRQWRDQAICSTDNSRQIDLGRNHNLSESQIRRIQKRARTNENQQDLFG